MTLLSPFGWIYSAAVRLRNRLYDRGSMRSFPLGAKTISIGNITTGGTGKTPIAALVIDILSRSGEKVCVLTRGYGRKTPTRRVPVSDHEKLLADAEIAGDEPVELARRFLGRAIVVADADRVAAGKWALDKFGVTAFVLDDGFQHRKARRDLDIVCINAVDPFGGGKLLPAGRLRERLSALARADAFVITRSDLADTGKIINILKRSNANAAIFHASTRLKNILTIDDFRLDPLKTGVVAVERPFVFCGLGQPDSFRSNLTAWGIEIAGIRTFRDHHVYSNADIRSIESTARIAGAGCLLTTAKDAVKLNDLDIQMDCFVVLAEAAVTEEREFEDLVIGAVHSKETEH